MGITIEEEQINQQLSKVELNEELNQKQQWRLEELEQDCQRLSMQHESFLSSILQTVEDEVKELHRQNFFELERDQDELKQEEKQLSLSEDELLWERKRIVMSKEDEEKKDGA